MKSSWIVKGVFAGILFMILAGGAVMYLWNYLMPQIFNLHEITFLQAIGLLVLSKIFFHGAGRCGAQGIWKYRMKQKWEKMSPDEREKFRSHWESKCKSWKCDLDKKE